jgi:glycosyltransferase involved in cell wall biosynthesis
MNILYLTNHLNIGGITSYVLTLGAGLKERGHKVYLASSEGGLLPRFKEGRFVYIPIPIKTKSEISPKILASALKIYKLARKYNIDIVHSNSRTTQVLGSILGRSMGVVHISTCHGFFKKRFSRQAFPCWGLKTIAISEPVKEHLVKDFKVDEKKIVVIHNGIDVEKFRVQSREYRVQARKDLGLGDGPVVGIVARLSDVKGHVYLIEAMKEVLAKIPLAHLLIVGEGKMKEELIKLVHKLGIAGNVFFVPEVSDTQGVLSAMDLFVMPSLKEGLGLSLMEAMASGLAVIGSDVGGIRTLIQHGHSGLLVKPSDTRGLAYAILELLGEPQKRQSFGKRAQEFIAQNFSQEKMVLKTEGVYLECLNAKS